MPHHEALNIMLEAEVIRCLYDDLGDRRGEARTISEALYMPGESRSSS
jgi:hypothetical protein